MREPGLKELLKYYLLQEDANTSLDKREGAVSNNGSNDKGADGVSIEFEVSLCEQDHKPYKANPQVWTDKHIRTKADLK